ncbi:hypothetical protein COO60DRAFT_1504531 [Scenedesmus sp. NREL 46B-D3]|nr:hypothetical protein COO60DRAFT_1504531 [Scenedesmus sp. NREL 46B-D3]
MNCTESLAGQMSQLSLQEDPCSTIKTMISIHQELIAALQQANAGAGQGDSAGSVLSEFQRITGCRRTEALFYLKQSNNDVRAAVAVWHSQVLQEYLQAFQQQQPHLQTYQQHSVHDAAQQMRGKAQKAAAAAANFEQGMAQNYLRCASSSVSALNPLHALRHTDRSACQRHITYAAAA